MIAPSYFLRSVPLPCGLKIFRVLVNEKALDRSLAIQPLKFVLIGLASGQH